MRRESVESVLIRLGDVMLVQRVERFWKWHLWTDGVYCVITVDEILANTYEKRLKFERTCLSDITSSPITSELI